MWVRAMSTKRVRSNRAGHPRGRRRKRRVLWVATGVAGLTGAVGLAASGVVTLPGASATGSLGNVVRPAAHRGCRAGYSPAGPGRPGHAAAAGMNPGGQDPSSGRQGTGRAGTRRQGAGRHGRALRHRRTDRRTQPGERRSRRDAQARARLHVPADAEPEGNGLPEIVRPVTIKGENATVLRATNAAAFRIFNVGVGGDLTLHDLTVKGGFAQPGLGGGGLLVQAGGRATILDSRITGNQSSSAGGGVTNFGVTRILSTRATGPDGKGKEPAGGEKDAAGTGHDDTAPGDLSGTGRDSPVDRQPHRPEHRRRSPRRAHGSRGHGHEGPRRPGHQGPRRPRNTDGTDTKAPGRRWTPTARRSPGTGPRRGPLAAPRPPGTRAAPAGTTRRTTGATTARTAGTAARSPTTPPWAAAAGSATSASSSSRASG